MDQRDSHRLPATEASPNAGARTPAAAASLSHRAFDPEPHAEELRAILREIAALPGAGDAPIERAVLDGILRRHPRAGSGFFSRSQLIAAYRRFASELDLRQPAEAFARRVQRRPVRTHSGVTPLTVLTRPFPCPGQCIFCPNDVRMPKSYLSDEPGAQRAAANRFDPYLQTWNRLAAYDAIGHPTGKIELIVLGGTWSFYPEAYQIWFAKRCFDALNDFGRGADRRGEAGGGALDFAALEGAVEGRLASPEAYNRRVSRFLKQRLDGRLSLAHESAEWSELERAQCENETSACRSVGFVVETRPDRVDTAEVARIRRLGCTKVQIGIQSLSDRVLALNKRGHDVAATRNAMRLLRGAGFKVHAHWMPNLHGSSPQADARDFARIFDDPDFRPDELKVYPCSLIESAELMHHYERGEWRPYTHEELLELLCGVLERVPRYCRLTRVIRDISSDDIVAGNKLTNFREIAERRHRERGGRSLDIRSREIKGAPVDPACLRLRATEYASATGREHFLEFVTPDDRVAGFLRLSLPALPAPIGEIDAAAIIREVHVYGPSLAIGAPAGETAQHRGLGQALIAEARERARGAGYAKLSVISAVGTRPYYRKLGFEDGALYQHYSLAGDGGLQTAS